MCSWHAHLCPSVSISSISRRISAASLLRTSGQASGHEKAIFVGETTSAQLRRLASSESLRQVAAQIVKGVAHIFFDMWSRGIPERSREPESGASAATVLLSARPPLWPPPLAPLSLPRGNQPLILRSCSRHRSRSARPGKRWSRSSSCLPRNFAPLSGSDSWPLRWLFRAAHVSTVRGGSDGDRASMQAGGCVGTLRVMIGAVGGRREYDVARGGRCAR